MFKSGCVCCRCIYIYIVDHLYLYFIIYAFDVIYVISAYIFSKCNWVKGGNARMEKKLAC